MRMSVEMDLAEAGHQAVNMSVFEPTSCCWKGYSQGLLAGVSIASYAISLAIEKGMKLTILTVKVLWLSFVYGSWLYFSLAL